jgi:hypothetical protein
LKYVSAVHAFPTQVASVRVPAAHDVVSCPDSEYPASHTGTQLDPDASSVSPAHVPAAALSGFVSFGYDDDIYEDELLEPLGLLDELLEQLEP